MPFWNGFKSFINYFIHNTISISKGSEIWNETAARKQENTPPCGLWPGSYTAQLLGCVQMLWRPSVQARETGNTVLSSAYDSSSIPGRCGSREPCTGVRVVKNPWKWWKGPGHSSDTVTCLIPLFYLGDEAVQLWSHFCIQAWIFNLCSPWSIGWASYRFINLEGLYILLINLNWRLQNLNLKSFPIPLFMVQIR